MSYIYVRMPIKRLHTVPIVLALLSFGLFQQSGEPAGTYHYYLGFSLMPGANSQPVTYHIVCVSDDPAKEASVQNITQREWMATAYGWGSAPANPDHENLFDKYEVANCGYTPDTIIHHVLYKGGLYCNPLNDLWRLAHSEWPFGSAAPANYPLPQQSVANPDGPGPGWAHDPYRPSDGQINILKGYGASDWIDIIYGDNAFHLLHDMQDPAWVSRYQSS